MEKEHFNELNKTFNHVCKVLRYFEEKFNFGAFLEEFSHT